MKKIAILFLVLFFISCGQENIEEMEQMEEMELVDSIPPHIIIH